MTKSMERVPTAAVDGSRALLPVLVCAGVLAAAGGLAAPATAQVSEWQGGVSSDWADGGNWQGGLPTGLDTAVIDSVSPNPTVVSAPGAEAQEVIVGLGGSGSLSLRDGGSLTVDGGNGVVTLGAAAGSNGLLAIGAASSDPAAAAAAGALDARTLLFGDGGGTLLFNHSDAGYDFALDIDGEGTIHVVAGTTRLSGDNSLHEGETLISGGRLVILDDFAISGLSDVTVGAGGTLEIADGAFFAEIASLSGAGNVEIGDAGLFVVGDADTTFSGSITGQGDFGYDGDGRLTLTGHSSIDGELTLCGCGDATLAIDGGSFSAAGGTIVSGGRLLVRNGGRLTTSDLVVETTLQVGGTGSRVTTAGDTVIGFVGPGSLQITGGGVLHTGGDAMMDALFGRTRARVTGPGSRWDIDGDLMLGGAFFGGAAEVTVANGGLLRTDGAVRIDSAGILRLGDGGRAGRIATPTIDNEGRIVADFTDRLRIDAEITGSGILVKRGGGTLELTGDGSTFTGTTRVGGGSLLVGVDGVGSLGGQLEIRRGGRLGGSGRVGNLVLGAGSVVAPGNSVGTLRVEGDATFHADSTYEVEIAAGGGAADRLRVDGQAFLNGATLAQLGGSDGYRPFRTYSILRADGGVVGTFGEVTTTFAFLRPELTYDANRVYMTLQRNDLRFASLAATGNQRSVARGADSLGPGQGVYDALVVLGADKAVLRRAYDALSGELHASARGAVLQGGRHLRQATISRLRQATAGGGPSAPQVAQLAMVGDTTPASAQPRERGLGVWAQAVGSWGSSDGDGNAARLDESHRGLLAGADLLVSDSWRLGLAAGFASGSLKAGDRSSESGVESYQLGVYAGGPLGPLAIRGGAGFAWHRLDSERRVSFPGLTETLRADYDGQSLQVFGEVAYPLALGPTALEPYLGLAYNRLRTESFRERGGAAALRVRGNSEGIGHATLGLRGATRFELGERGSVTASGGLGWQRALGGTTPSMQAAFAGGRRFGIEGVPLARDSLVLEAGLEAQLGGGVALGLAYDGKLARRSREHGARLTVSLRF